VDILGLRLPRWRREEALDFLLARLRQGLSTGVAFADMSTVNVCRDHPDFEHLLQTRLLVLNDGAGLDFAAWRRGRPFPANLNGTDLTPELLRQAPEGTRCYLVGTRPDRIEQAARRLSEAFPHLSFVGWDHGFFDLDGEGAVTDQIAATGARIVLVGMGNPRQVRFIGRHLDDPRFQGVLWMAVGGLLDYWGGALRRAPRWMRRNRLEWLYVVGQQPYKARRYFLGIPKYLGRVVLADLKGTHRHPDDSGPSSEDPVFRARLKGEARNLLSRYAPARDPLAPRILCYHGVSAHSGDEWTVRPDRLRAQMEWIREHRVPVSLDRVVGWLQGQEDLPPGAVAVTFDDGFQGVLREAVPILRDTGIPATLFVTSGLARGGANAAHPSFQVKHALLRPEEVREVRKAGWTIGSHGLSHAPLARLDARSARHELVDSRHELEDLLGEPVTLLAYPYGTPGTVSARDRALASLSGYEAAFMAVTGPLHRDDPRFSLRRCKVLGTDPFETFQAMLEGRLDLWQWMERSH
jgi:N-acetylglucosaminyldiphosphoundecaprenol N-acetyl-beta-D-mannosaminyltransferase